MKIKLCLLANLLVAALNAGGQVASNANFTRILTGPISAATGSSIGPAWGDYDDDGRSDLFVANRELRANFLFHNEGGGNFTRVTTGLLVNDISDSFGASWVDYNNDTDLDLFVANCCIHFTNANDFLYFNDSGVFEKVVSDAVVQDFAASTTGAWADYDRDGRVDLHVAANPASLLFRNNVSGVSGFSRMTAGSAGDAANDTGASFGSAWGDYNNDGWPDLFISHAFGVNNALYRNNGDGTFSQMSAGEAGSLVGDGGDSSAPAWGDYNNDGHLDLFVPNYAERHFLYRNNGEGSFTRITNDVVVTDTPLHSQTSAWVDYDNDGYLDLFVPNGDESTRTPEPNALYRNNGNGTFAKITTGNIFTDGGISRSAAWGDYDNDGFLDLFVGNGGGPGSPNEVNFLYHNNGNSNNWLNVRCIGWKSNRSAIGAKVRVKATIGGKTFWQLREISSGGGLGQHDIRANFGLGDATNAQTLRIEWPSGIVQEFQNVQAKQFLTITESPTLEFAGLAPDGAFQLRFNGSRGFRYEIQSSTNFNTWTPFLAVTSTSPGMLLSDPSRTNFPQRFYRAMSRP